MPFISEFLFFKFLEKHLFSRKLSILIKIYFYFLCSIAFIEYFIILSICFIYSYTFIFPLTCLFVHCLFVWTTLLQDKSTYKYYVFLSQLCISISLDFAFYLYFIIIVCVLACAWCVWKGTYSVGLMGRSEENCGVSPSTFTLISLMDQLLGLCDNFSTCLQTSSYTLLLFGLHHPFPSHSGLFPPKSAFP